MPDLVSVIKNKIGGDQFLGNNDHGPVTSTSERAHQQPASEPAPSGNTASRQNLEGKTDDAATLQSAQKSSKDSSLSFNKAPQTTNKNTKRLSGIPRPRAPENN
jgi:hypothetical protein